MRLTGKIEKINQIIVSDPSYDNSVSCRYERNNINGTNWIFDMEINKVTEKIDEIEIKGLEFFVLLKNPKQYCKLNEDGSISYSSKNKITKTEIGIDTACVAIGINSFSDNIREKIGEWQPDNSLSTLYDGLFGSVREGKIGNQVNFICISGYLDEDTGYSIRDITEYITTQFEVKELYQEKQNTRFPVINDDLDDINYEL